MRIEKLRKYVLIGGILASGILLAQPARAQQLSSSSVMPATAAADVASGAVSIPVAAHPSQNFETTPIANLPDAPVASKELGRIGVERLPSRREWLALSIVQHSAAVFDAYSTRQAIASGATEQNPMLRPFAKSPAIYAATQVAPLAFDYAARRMQLSRNSFIRHIWWAPQTAGTAVSIFAGAHNMRIANRP
ncbi:MAG TPA: hypothetical protein VMB02_17100 [Candidatus Aquilonibacter sp.]|nr:hypothetical protein [Candidatus Aquilonibacter sp.]